MESRLEEIEAKLGLAEDLLDELNKTVYRQQQQIDRLQRELTAVCEQIRTSMPAGPGSLPDGIPPHY